MNPRIQVEHTITEMATGIDIVQSQILVAQGYRLDSEEINIKSQESVKHRGFFYTMQSNNRRSSQ